MEATFVPILVEQIESIVAKEERHELNGRQSAGSTALLSLNESQSLPQNFGEIFIH